MQHLTIKAKVFKYNEKKGTWISPEIYSDLKTLKVKPADFTYIKSLLEGWDIAELDTSGIDDYILEINE